MNAIRLDATAVLALVAVAVVGVGVLWVARNKEKFDPSSDKNLAYGAVNDAGRVLSGDEHFSLGGWLWELTHPGAVEREAQVSKPAPVSSPVWNEQHEPSPFGFGA